ncbi:MAG: hypothetical protein ACK51N_06300 [bacterium]|jgi:hypothetical protein|nr:tetratricopeptide repeat protein [Phycisphaerales bacterium]MCE2654379.1 tetratricopeptide repeat protein [Planctomycetaceae bacterium]
MAPVMQPHHHDAIRNHPSAGPVSAAAAAEHPDVVTFKYHGVDAQGKQSTTFRRRGRIDEHALTLGKQQYPLTNLHSAKCVHSRVAIGLESLTHPGQATVVVIQTSPKSARQVVRALNRSVSLQVIAAARRQLTAEGRLGLLRSCLCPGCGCTIDLSGRRASPEVYCPYCDSVWSLQDTGDRRRDEEARQRHCDGCGLYGRPDTITCGYIIFLLVAVIYRYQIRELCTTCMRRESWKMVGTNLVGLIGEVHAVPQLVRSYVRARPAGRHFAGLEAANALATGRRPERAEDSYRQIIARLGHCAGVRYNAGNACVRAGRLAEAVEHFAHALGDCSNYKPSVDALAACYRRLGMHEQLEALKAHWRLDPSSGADAPPAQPPTPRTNRPPRL